MSAACVYWAQDDDCRVADTGTVSTKVLKAYIVA